LCDPDPLNPSNSENRENRGQTGRSPRNSVAGTRSASINNLKGGRLSQSGDRPYRRSGDRRYGRPWEPKNLSVSWRGRQSGHWHLEKEVAPERKLRTSGKANLFLNRNGVGNAGNIPSVPGFSDIKGIHMELADPLGTKRVQVDTAGLVDETCTSLPFGNDINDPEALYGTSCIPVSNSLGTEDDATEHHFTGKERDAESGNDYFGARYYASTMGRFLSPDWSAKAEPVPYAKLDNPQTLNLYGYMRNNPLGGVDQDGHCDWCWNLVTTVSTYVATHPAIGQALQKLGDSVGIKLTAGVGRKVEIGGVKLGAAATVTSETRVDGTGSSKVQLTGAASVGGVGVQGNGTATFEKNGSLVNPLDNLGGNAKLTGSAAHGDNTSNSNAAIGTDDRVAVGVGVNVGVAQAGVQVTAGTQELQGVASSVGDAAIQDTKQFATDLKTSTTCGTGGCARPQ
jgi:RHS repeat-associated protein